MDQATMRVREAEREFLKWGWWVFPLAGVVVAMLTGGGFWAWVDGEMPWLEWRQAFALRGLALAVAGVLLAGVWRALVRWKSPGGVVMMVAALGFVGAECAVRIPLTQTAFWLAVRARLAACGTSFMSEVCYIRLEEAVGRKEGEGAVILSGTSQMLRGVDELELGRMLAPVPVIRREVSGMVPRNMLAAWSWIPFHRGDCIVQLRSEMDFTNQAEFRASWYRPFLTWQTFPWLLRNAGNEVCTRYWRDVVDCAMAATLEGWRMRDGWREIALNPWRRAEGDPAATPSAMDIDTATSSLAWCEWEWHAFTEEAERLKAAGVQLVVFEGDVNPVLHNPIRAEMRREFERRMLEGERAGLWRFVAEGEMETGIGEDDWADMSHLNGMGREKLTRTMGRMLRGLCQSTASGKVPVAEIGRQYVD